MKTSIRNKLISKVLKIVRIKNLNEKPEYLEKQRRQNTKLITPPFTHLRQWNKHNLGEFYYFSSKAKNYKKIIIYFHGGSFVCTPTIFHWNYLKKLKKITKLPIYFPIYPKAPNYNYKIAYEFLFKFFTAIEKKHPNAAFIFMGDSAGGNIALSFALQLKEKEKKIPEKIIVFSPCLDLTFSNKKIDEIEKQNLDPLLTKKQTKFLSQQWIKPRKDPQHPIFSPINADFKGLNNILLFAGTHEILHPEACEFYKKLFNEKINIKFIEKQELMHAWPLHPIKEAKQALDMVKNFINDNELY